MIILNKNKCLDFQIINTKMYLLFRKMILEYIKIKNIYIS